MSHPTRADAWSLLCEWTPSDALRRHGLAATIDVWQNAYTEANGTGAVDPAAWEAAITFMRSLPDSPVARAVTVEECLADALLPPR